VRKERKLKLKQRLTPGERFQCGFESHPRRACRGSPTGRGGPPDQAQILAPDSASAAESPDRAARAEHPRDASSILVRRARTAVA